MTWPNWSKVGLIARRELLDQLRDHRALFMVVCLPLLLYPIVGVGLYQLAQFLRKHPANALVIAEVDDDDSTRIERLREVLTARSEDAIRLHLQWQTPDSPGQDWSTIATDLISRGTYDVLVTLPSEFVLDLERYDRFATRQGRDDPTSTARPRLYYDAARDRSELAYQRMDRILRVWQSPVDSTAMTASSLPEDGRVAFGAVQVTDLANSQNRGIAFWAKILPFIVFVWALTGAFYPAIDFCAGEKERGTLETLLSSAAHRLDIVWGKIVATMVFSAVTAILNLVCMMVTATFALRQFAEVASPGMSWQTGIPPWSSFLWILAALLPISILFSSLAMALASVARSTKEGQYYLLPLMMIFMPLMLISILPSARLDGGTSLLPVTGIMLCLRHLMEGEYLPVWTFGLPALLMTALCCSISIRWAVEQFHREDVLFRTGDKFTWAPWLTGLRAYRCTSPTGSQALLCGFIILFARYFAGGWLGFPDSWRGFVVYTLGTLLAFVAGPALCLAAWCTSSIHKSLLLQRADVRTILAGILLAACLHPIAMLLLVTIRQTFPIDGDALLPFQDLLASAPSVWSLLAVMALAPAICEELAFRGFILSGLRSVCSARRAVVFSSVLFALAHGVIQQSILAGVFGLLLGFLAVQTNSIWPCMAFHITHNALGILAADWLEAWSQSSHPALPVVYQIADPSSGGTTFAYGAVLWMPGLVLASGILLWLIRYRRIVDISRDVKSD